MDTIGIELVFKRIKEDGGFLPSYLNGMSSLHDSGLLLFLKERARAVAVGNGGDPQIMAYQAARSVGYQQCLDDLLYFRELYLTPEPEKLPGKMDFGGSDIALRKGDLTQEELHAASTGHTPELKPIDISNYVPGQPTHKS